MADKERDDDEVTVTRGQLRELLEKEKRDAAMSDDEKHVRGMIREEVSAAFDSLFEDTSDDDDDEPKRKQSPKGSKPKGGLLDSFLGKS